MMTTLGSSSARGRGSFLAPTLTHNQKSCLESIVDFQFIENIRQMSLDSFFANENSFANLLIGQSLGHEFEYFSLSLRQSADHIVVAEIAVPS